MSDTTPSIPILMAVCPFTLKVGETIGDQTLHRGGLIKIGDASPAAGGGPVYASELSGAWIKFDPATGIGVPVTPKPPTFDQTYQIRLWDGKLSTQPGFDWVTATGVGDGARLYNYQVTNGPSQ